MRHMRQKIIHPNAGPRDEGRKTKRTIAAFVDATVFMTFKDLGERQRKQTQDLVFESLELLFNRYDVPIPPELLKALKRPTLG